MADTNGHLEINTVENNQITQRDQIPKAHNGAIWQVSWSHPVDSNLGILATCGYDQQIKIWRYSKDAGAGWECFESFSQEASVNCV